MHDNDWKLSNLVIVHVISYISLQMRFKKENDISFHNFNLKTNLIVLGDIDPLFIAV